MPKGAAEIVKKMSNVGWAPPTITGQLKMISKTTSLFLAMPVAIIAGSILWCDRVYGQILPDNSLGAESSVVTPAVTNGIEGQRIDGGAVRGANLFHSFSEFNVNSLDAAYFANPSGIENILSRVTGSNISKIFGTLGVLGNANLFLINPNGIVFGPNARLDLGGSFVGTTADSVVFGNGFEFSAKNPQAPPLLTINIPRGLNLRQNQGAISVEGTGNPDIIPTEVSTGLAVAPGKTLALVGSDVTLTDAIVTAPSGRIEIGSVLDGSVSLTQSISGLELGYSQVESFGEIKLLETSSVWNPNIIANPSAGIFVHGGKVRLEGRSQIASLTVADSPGNDIVINAAESLEVGGVDENIFPYSSWVVNQVAPQATGNGGDITVTTPRLSIRDGGRIQTISQGAGGAGNVEVNADIIELNGFSPISSSLPVGFTNILHSRIASENYSTGPGGNIKISTRQLNMHNGGEVLSQVGPDATGAGGTIVVNASQSITGIGVNPFNFNNGIVSNSFGMGNGGDIFVSTRKLMLSDGAHINSIVAGSGRGGSLFVNASESIEAIGINSFLPISVSFILSLTVGPADSGDISISTQELRLLDGGSVRSLSLIELLGEQVPGAGTGNAGNIEVVASEVELRGTAVLAPENFSSLSSFTLGSGNGGDVSLSTRRLTIEGGASLSSAVFSSATLLGVPLPGSGTGKSGNLRVNASTTISVIGTGIGAAGPSDLGTFTFGEGDAGDTVISTQKLTIANGGDINSTTFSGGNAGRLTINATEQMVVSGIGANGESSVVSASAESVSEVERLAFFLPPLPSGNTGELTINTPRLIVSNGGRVSVEHVGDGDAGSMQLLTDEIFLSNGGSITASTASGQGGNVILNVRDSLQLRNDSAIAVEANGDIGDGGNLTVNAETIALLSGSKITANAVRGDGGNINITATGLFSSNDSAITASSRFGVDGVVSVDTPDTDPTSGLIELSNNVVDAASLIGKDFCAIRRESSFIVTGRGGLPPNPNQDIITNTALGSWIEPVQPTEGRSRSFAPQQLANSQKISSATMVPARGWIFQPDGSVLLVGYDPTKTGIGRLPNTQRCGSNYLEDE